MRAVDIIGKKRLGRTLTAEEIRWFVQANLRGEVADYQTTALLMAVCDHGLNAGETLALTHAFMESGAVLDLTGISGPKVDKHSTGGVGDKVSLILAPLVACAGLRVPMIAGRGLGHTGGTIDKLEALPGYDPFPPLDRFVEIVATVGCSIIGQTEEICRADGQWYALRDVTATVENIALITASILSKKAAAGIEALVLDVKFGSGAFMATIDEAEALGRSLATVGAQLGLRVRAVLTDMSEPLGREIGNANEMAEAIEILNGRGDRRLADLCVELGAHMLDVGGLEHDLAAGAAQLRGLLANGRALAKFGEWVRAHGADPAYVEHPERLPRAAAARDFVAPRAGFLILMQTAEIGRAARDLGAGRARVDEVLDFGAGITMHKRLGDRVAAGEPLCTLRAVTADRLAAAAERLTGAFTIGPQPPELRPTIRKVVAAA